MKRQKGNGLISLSPTKLQDYNTLNYNYQQLRLSDDAHIKFHDVYDFKIQHNFNLEEILFKSIKSNTLRYSINECLNQKDGFNKNLVRLLGSDCEFSQLSSDTKLPVFQEMAELVHRTSQTRLSRLSRVSDYDIQSSYSALPIMNFNQGIKQEVSFDISSTEDFHVQTPRKIVPQKSVSLQLQPLKEMNFSQESSEILQSPQRTYLNYYQAIEVSEEEISSKDASRPSSYKPNVKGPLGLRRNK
ncbi:hypothetical protein SS50377_28622 [Spironucleus salmonicida]|uniref:Uncharacterized protein n=1 Tax=Spironucleus salmonicida TaxID=348837 RepID=V6LLI8_9EUKA|nr:hypothetical protein SS50377_28622 [Spironucleus salmonicida]|eukprot:EST41559.1 Hypothetical protein SS50377_18899 [Spironucleus salmonicida]